VKLWRWFLELIDSAATPIEPPPQPTQPAAWRRSDESEVVDTLTARVLRAQCRAQIVSAATLSFRANIPLTRLRAVLLEKEPATPAELQRIRVELENIQIDRRRLLALAEANDLMVGPIF